MTKVKDRGNRWLIECIGAAERFSRFCWPKHETFARNQIEDAFYEGAAWATGSRDEYDAKPGQCHSPTCPHGSECVHAKP